MKHFATILLLALCSAASAQTIKTLGYNTTNGEVVAATNVVWTNAFTFSTNTVAAQVRSNLGLGPNISPTFSGLLLQGDQDASLEIINDDQEKIFLNLRIGTNSNVTNSIEITFDTVLFNSALSFGDPATTRTNLGLGGGITATNVFVDLSTNTNTVTISNGIITSWTVAP